MYESLKTSQIPVESPPGANPPSNDALPQDTWDRLLKQTEAFAAQQAAVRWWRHAHDGVMPDGYDPNSIAAQALTDLLQHRNPPAGRDLTETEILQVQSQLEYLVRKIVDRLRHRKENSLLCNEPDLATIFTDDGEAVRIVETIPDPSPNPAQVLLHNEHTAEVDRLQNAFEASLAKDRPLKSLFASFRRGLTTPRALARKLRRTRPAIRNLQKRLMRKWARFLNRQRASE